MHYKSNHLKSNELFREFSYKRNCRYRILKDETGVARHSFGQVPLIH